MKKLAKSSVTKPIFVVGAGHSGTSLLARAISEEPSITSWDENNKTWIWGNAFNKNDLLTADDLTPQIKKHITKRFTQYVNKSGGKRVCDKTPKNCLRIPFILSVFPDAKIIHIVRDGRAVISSTQSRINDKSYSLWKHLQVKLKGSSVMDWYVFLPRIFFVIKKVLGLPTNYWGSKPQGWEDWSEDDYNVKLAKQWSQTVSVASDRGREFAHQNYLEIHYEDLIDSPTETIRKVAQFAEIEDPQAIIDFCESKIDPSRNQKRIKNLSKDDTQEIMTIIQPTLLKLGYE